MNIQGQIGVYIHWPFCLSKCPYCDFNSHVHDTIDHVRWQVAYLRALEHYAEQLRGRTLTSIFFGGGTPSLMMPETVGAIIDKARALWPQVNDLEVTLEANPTSIEGQKFAAFKAAGVNRVSVGVQALNDTDLQFLGRQHSAAEALTAIEIAHKIFDRFSFDLIYARPNQSLEAWRAELDLAVELAGGHLSLYQLIIERNTPFYFDHARGLFALPGEEQACSFYNLTQDVLEGAGLPAYEVSNHARAGQESRHNLIYWHYGDYVGIGPGAHGRLSRDDGSRVATREHSAPQVWLDRVEANGYVGHPAQMLSREERFMEAFMMGLRLREGVELKHLSVQGGQDWHAFIDMERLQIVQNEGWVLLDDDKMRLSREGMLRLNALIPYILKAESFVGQAA
ncbi:MAG TPA: radical SAM family heme chaperone HemW [Alphaproteobacteria bacterium]|nr:coproporphyrinogen III oxidase [Alphaproteobacteria bacterium]USO05898.1 MAG: coproporphyrinogen III oxidase [Rhodospirillales bacterium]HOO81029.1 radical SAM family heme chaperone HemW [Alphaproteobacteria bacterium]